jgi:hypothetical protein
LICPLLCLCWSGARAPGSRWSRLGSKTITPVGFWWVRVVTAVIAVWAASPCCQYNWASFHLHVASFMCWSSDLSWMRGSRRPRFWLAM